MKGFVYTKPFTLEMQDLPMPVPGAGEVVVKVTGCGVCGTDDHIFAGEVSLARPPVVLGHEITGEVFEVGKGVDDLQLGQTVCIDPVIPCGKCEWCAVSRPNLCSNPTILGYHVTGGFAEYTKAPRTHIYPIKAELGPKAGVIVEPLACVLHGYDRLNLTAGSSVLVLGAGPIALIWTQFLSQSPISRLVQTDVVPERCAKALSLGAQEVINVARESLEEFVKDTQPKGFDYVIDVTGNPEAVRQGFQFVKFGGTFMVFGVSPEGSTWNIDPYVVFNKELTILGAKMPPHTIGRAVNLVESGRIDFGTIISHEYPLQMLEEALEYFKHRKDMVLKMSINPTL